MSVWVNHHNSIDESQIPSSLKWSKMIKCSWALTMPETDMQCVSGVAVVPPPPSRNPSLVAEKHGMIYLERGPTGWVWHGRAPSGDSSAGRGGSRTPRCSSPCLQTSRYFHIFSHVKSWGSITPVQTDRRVMMLKQDSLSSICPQ